MRKTSHDGGDSSSITSGIEFELKKPILSILKPIKKSSLKRKPSSTFKEVDETVVEPLLSQDKEKPGTSQSAKFFTKSKTDTINDKISDRSKLLGNNNIQNPISSAIITTANTADDRYVPKSTINAPIHNHMNTNVFNSHDSNKIAVTTKSQILVEIDSCKPVGYSPSPLIFTTAKIHADGKAKHMEPVQVTPVPILSTVELSLSKNGNVTTNEKKVATAINGTPLIGTVLNPDIISKYDNKTTTENSNTVVTSPSLNSTGTSKPVVTNQNKSSTTISNIVGSISNNLTTINNEKMINKGENIISNPKKKDESISTPEVSTNPSTTEQNKAITSVKLTNPVIEPNKPAVSAINQVQTNQSNKQSGKSLTDQMKSNSESTQVIDYKIKDSIQANKSNTGSTTIIKPNNSNDSAKLSSRSDNKQLQRQKSIAVEETPRSKTTPALNTSNKVDTTKGSSAKIVASSAKLNSMIQPKTQNNTSLSKDKMPKPGANEIKTETSKSSQTRTADSSSNKVTSSNTTDKQPNINLKTTNKPLSTTKNDNTSSTPNITKNVSVAKISSNLPKNSTSTVTPKSTAVPTTKGTSKVTTVTSQKPQSSSVTSVTSTKPTGSGKTQLPASSVTSSVTKASSVSASSTPISSVATSKSATNKSAPSVSTSDATTSVSVLPTSISVASANGIPKSDIMKKGSKSSDLTKDSKTSKA